MFEVEYLKNGWVKKDGVNTNLVLYAIGLPLDTLIDLVFSPRLTQSMGHCVLGKDTLRLFLIGAKHFTRCGGPAWPKPWKQNRKKCSV